MGIFYYQRMHVHGCLGTTQELLPYFRLQE